MSIVVELLIQIARVLRIWIELQVLHLRNNEMIQIWK